MTTCKKITLTAAAMVLSAGLAVGGTLAYLNAVTETKTNTFTSSRNITTTLTETEWTSDSGKNYLPGDVIKKNPVMNNESDQPVYMAVKVDYLDDNGNLMSAEEFKKYDKKDSTKLDMIANLLCREIITGKTNKTIDIFKEKQSYQKGIYLVADFINHNYNKEIKIEEMAQLAGLSKNYFGSAFKKALGETPHSYLIKIRISKAKVLLETTDYSLSDIAKEIGFRKASSFTSQFKASTGIIPSKYREKSKKHY